MCVCARAGSRARLSKEHSRRSSIDSEATKGPQRLSSTNSNVNGAGSDGQNQPLFDVDRLGNGGLRGQDQLQARGRASCSSASAPVFVRGRTPESMHAFMLSLCLCSRLCAWVFACICASLCFAHVRALVNVRVCLCVLGAYFVYVCTVCT